MIAGIDEAGRGPLAGPVVAAAVILPRLYDLPGLTDSKKLSVVKREALFIAIKEQALAIGLGLATHEEIDALNIHHATLLAMKRAYEAMGKPAEKALIDGKFVPDLPIVCEAMVGGDLLEPAISAASIMAKVTRDRIMLDYHQLHPEYGFDKHSGYPTKAHLEALQKFGILPIHRRSYAPVKKIMA